MRVKYMHFPREIINMLYMYSVFLSYVGEIYKFMCEVFFLHNGILDKFYLLVRCLQN